MDSEHLDDRVYLLPYRWWIDSKVDRVQGVLYTVCSMDDNRDSVSLHLSMEEDSEKIKNLEGGFLGRHYALVPEGVWLCELKRYNDLNNAEKDFGRLFYAEDCLLDLFPLQLMITASFKTSSLLAEIREKENVPDFYKKAHDIFKPAYDSLYIWDFSRKITQLLLSDKARVQNDCSGQLGKEVLLKLQVHGLADSTKGSQSNRMISYKAVRSLGLTGLHNLGNTCFINSAVQCLAHTPVFVDFFLGDYRRKINYENTLGRNGEIALSFGDLLRKLWAPGASPLSPTTFMMKLTKFASEFGDSKQHDSQELLAFLLDGLHEDLNRINSRPSRVVEADGRPDEEVAEEYWRNYLDCNDSIVIDLFHGQYRSTLICLSCKEVSIKFDPFVYLTLHLPSTTIRTMTVTVMSTDGVTLPSQITVTVPKCGTLEDLIGALTASCSLRDDETLLVAEIYRSRIFRLSEDKIFKLPSDSLADISDLDTLVAYRVQKNTQDSFLVVFMHERVVESCKEGGFENRIFGFPLVARLSGISCRGDPRTEFLNLMTPFLMQYFEETIDEYDEDKDDIHLWNDFEFYLLRSMRGETLKITSKEPLPAAMLSGTLEVAVVWSDKMLKKYDTNLLDSLPRVFEPHFSTNITQESTSIYTCLEDFLRKEPLGPEDEWNCPTCKTKREATKKIDLWRLPKILVVHLKRFEFEAAVGQKLETFVDFPTNDLDLSTYVAHKSCPSPNCYMLYAIICHHGGGLEEGHYTAFVRYGHDKWYNFADSSVTPVEEENIKTHAAYILFYKKV